MSHPLTGLRVLDLSRVLSGPFAGRLLADLGADVVKVEPPEGDVTRRWGKVQAGRAGFYFQQNVGKRGLCVDLKAPGGAEIVLRLAAEADVLIENFRPGVLDRLGLPFSRLHAVNPRLVLLSISGFGMTGPARDRPAYAPVVQAETGLVRRQADLDGHRPVDLVYSLADTTASLHGLVAVLAALRHRDSTGLGQHIDLAMLDALLATDDYVHHAVDDSPLQRLGGEVWATVGGDLVLAGELKFVWHQLHTVHGLTDPTPPGADLETKIRCRRAAIAGWFARFTERSAVVAALDEAGIAWGDVADQRDVVRSDQAMVRGVVVTVPDGGGGHRDVIQSPYRFSAAESGARGAAPARGEHTREVLVEWCGMGDTEIAALVTSGVLLQEG
jgi:CoA:oxalate CoA-transferase